MPLKLLFRLTACLLVVLLGSVAVAQDTNGLTTDEIIILNRINASRLRENLVHLVPDETLNGVAERYVDDLMARPIDALGDVLRTRRNETIDDLLRDAGYEAYPNGYAVDFIPVVVRDFGPNDIIDFWINDFRQPEPQMRTRRNVRFDDPQLPIFSALYREIGISWKFNATTQRHYYVIIFAAQPNVLPVVATHRNTITEIVRTVSQPEVVLYIHDERVNRFGQGSMIGAVEKIRIAEQPGELACENTSSPDWQPYNNEVLWSLSPGNGTKTIYVQMCDAAGRSITTSVQVDLVDQAAVPDIMGVVRITQTAAAEATAFAPYQPTIRAVLTATAAAQATPTPR